MARRNRGTGTSTSCFVSARRLTGMRSALARLHGLGADVTVSVSECVRVCLSVCLIDMRVTFAFTFTFAFNFMNMIVNVNKCLY